MEFKFLDREFWYGGYVYGAAAQPFDENSDIQISLIRNESHNQAMPLFLSSKGRYIWCEEGFVISFQKGRIVTDRDVELKEGYGNLRGAYLAASKAHFPFENITLSDEFFRNPVYNSWIELTYDQNQEDILNYAEHILENGMKPGVLMIDDGWSDYYGKWKFNKERFPHPEEMIEKLHQKGFFVMLWLCPYISPDTLEFRQTRDKGFLIKDENGEPLITQWWNGYSAALDLSNPEAVEWLDRQLNELKEAGVDGFKLDGADVMYYPDSMVTAGNVSPNEMARLWCAYGERFAFNELRMAFKAGGMSLMQRLCDKPHEWGDPGVMSLVPDTLLQGITGHPFGSPDMIGGGEYLNFQEDNFRLDEELFVRHSEIACLLPVMQFSAAPWRVLKKENFQKVVRSVKIRERYTALILELARRAKETGEPIVRYMAYEFPDAGMEKVNDQFMLGSRLLVAPVYKKGCTSRSVSVPEGTWEWGDETLRSKGEIYELTPPEGEPVILKRIG